jgi:putative acetyltransferase
MGTLQNIERLRDDVPWQAARQSAMRLRSTNAGDAANLAALYSTAFPNEDLTPLVRRLLSEVPDILSLVAEVERGLAGHVVFTPCAISDSVQRVGLLGPLAVAPAMQKRGIGTALVQGGLETLRDSGYARVLVLGDPHYYSRFGFKREDRIQPPYALPANWSGAWQGRALLADTAPLEGLLCPPGPWMVPSLWAP